MERTLAIIKPDAVAQGITGEVIRRIQASGLTIVGMKMLHLNKRKAEGFYYVHRSKPFFPTLVDFMSSGPVVVMALEGNDAIKQWRKLMGATNPAEADKDTIRKDYGFSIEKNAVHGSDAPETASFEIGYFFNGLEIFKIDPDRVRQSGTKP
jgi:nucleoside-diphosphate kinase